MQFTAAATAPVATASRAIAMDEGLERSAIKLSNNIDQKNVAAWWMAERMNARMTEIDAGHMMPLTHRVDVAAAILAWTIRSASGQIAR